MTITLYTVAALFLIGLVQASLKTRKFVNAITEERAKEIKFEITWVSFVKNPFYGLWIVVLGLVEVVRMSLVLIAECGQICLHIVKTVYSTVFNDHNSFAQGYNFVIANHKVLKKSDLENIAKTYNVPMSHLVRLSLSPTFTTLISVIKERSKFLDLSGEQLEQLLNSIDKLGIDYLKQNRTSNKEM